MQNSENLCFSELVETEVTHGVVHYERSLSEWGTGAGNFPTVRYEEKFIDPDYSVPVPIKRTVKVKQSYVPVIHEAELIKVSTEEKGEKLRLRLTGQDLYHVVLGKCDFNFGFPFGQNPDKCQVM